MSRNRILALTLAIVMLCAMLPASVFAAGELSLQTIDALRNVTVGETEVIGIGAFEGAAQISMEKMTAFSVTSSDPDVADILVEHTGKGNGTTVDFAAYAASADKKKPKEATVAEDGFAVDVANSTAMGLKSDSMFTWKTYGMYLLNSAKGGVLTLTIPVERDGYYALAVQGTASASGNVSSFALNGTLMGEYSFNKSGKDEVAQPEQQMGGVYLEQGTATVTVTKTGGSNYMMLSRLALVPLGDTVNLKVIGKEIGTTEVTVAATVDGEAVSTSFELSVKGKSGVVFSLENTAPFESVPVGATASSKLTLLVDGLPAGEDDFVSITAEADDPLLIAETAVRFDKGNAYLDVTAKNVGDTTVMVTAQHETYGAYTVEVPVSVIGKEYVYNFLKLHKGGNSENGLDPDEVTDFSQTTMGHVNEINPKQGAYTDPWYYVRPRPSDDLAWAYIQYGLMWKATGVGQTITFAIDVPSSGFYHVNMDCLQFNTCGITQAYIAPIDTDEPCAEEYKVGEPFDTYAEVQNNCANYPLDNVYLEKGQYYFSLEMVGKNAGSSTYRMGFGALRLSVAEEREFGFRLDREKVMVESGAAVEVLPIYNGTVFSAEELSDITVTNENDEVLTASERMEDGKLLLDVSALELGESILTVSANYRGEDFASELALEVVPQDELLSASLTAPVTSAVAGEEVTLSAKATLFDGSELFPGDEGVGFDWRSSDTSVADVTDDGVVLAKGMGTADITVTVTRGDVVKRAKMKFTVTSDYPLVAVSLKGLDGVAVGSSVQYRVEGRLVNGAPIPDSATVEWIVVSDENGAIELSADGVILGLNEGEATVKARVTMPDGTFLETEEKTVTVYAVESDDPIVDGPQEVLIDFKKYNGSEFEPRDITVEEDGWQVNKTSSSATIMALPSNSFRWQIYGLNCLMNDEVLCLDINIPASGYYRLSVTGGQYGAGIVGGFYMNDEYLGAYDMFDSGAIPVGEEATLDIVYLEEGVNQLYIKRNVPRTKLETYLYLGTLRFTPVDSLPTRGETALRVTKTQLSIGEIAWLYPGVQLSDGTCDYIGYSAETFGVDPENSYTLTVNGDSIKIRNGKITAVKAGVTTLNMKGVIGGEDFDETVTVTVDDLKLGIIIASFDAEELDPGDTAALTVRVFMEDGREVDLSDVTLSYASTNEGIAKVENGVLKASQSGAVQITVSATMNGKTVSVVLPVEVQGARVVDAKIKSPFSAIKPTDEGYQLSVVGVTETGSESGIPGATVVWSTTTPDLVDITADGFVTPKAVGSAVIKATVNYKEFTYYPEYVLSVRIGKTGPTYYTEDRISAMEENVANYDWAKEIKDAAITDAENLLDKKADYLDFVYNNMITGQEIPRGITIGFRLDPNAYYCKYCNVDLRKDFGLYEWLHDPYNYPWKIQCPSCMRRFPSNDFGKFYEAGLDEHGVFDYTLALEKGSHLLVNTDFPEMDEHVDKNGVLQNEGVHGWGVDDSRGYVTGNTYFFSQSAYMKNYFNLDIPEQAPETWPFIAYYAHYALYYPAAAKGQLFTALWKMTDAYLYSRDAKYGRIAAILLDRMADLYPDMYTGTWFPYHFNSDSTTPLGKYVGCIWQHSINRQMMKSYDALYHMYDDPYVINYLSGKAKELNIDEDYYVPDYLSPDYDVEGYKDPNYVEPMKLREGNPKTSGDLIRQNIETNIIAETAEDLYTGQIHGNFGMHQSLAAYTAVVWDTPPYTGQLIDWMNASSEDGFISAAQGKRISGANFLQTITQTVSRDGTGNEASPNYNNIWIPLAVIDALAGYEGYESADQFQNPKILMMYKQNLPLTLLRRETAAIGDSGRLTENSFINVSMGRPFLATGDVEMGQYLYLRNGNTTEGMHDDIFDDSSKMAEMVDEIIKQHGEMDFDKSEQMTGFGFSITRGGTRIEDNAATYDSQRYNYIYYGKNYSHGHPAAMDLQMGAFGMKITADDGYPEAADGAYKNTVWGKATINHNLVMVDAAVQSAMDIGFPRHFDDAGRVKLIDVEAEGAYTQTEEYRRTVFMVEVDDDTAYSVDFFRVKGGNDHIYAFRAVSNNIVENSLEDKLVTQTKGTYAGKDIEIGGQEALGVRNAFDFLYNVRRASYPGSTFQLDFKIDDVSKVGRNNVHLKMTMLNDFDLTEVAFAKGQPPQRDDNPEELEHVLVRRQGKNLDSLFTTVFEPYQESVHEDGYIASQEVVSMKRVAGPWEDEYDESKALKITLKNGRVDYVVYATNNKITYVVDDRFEFCGFAGVYTLENDAAEEPIYAYVNDGTKIGETEGIAGYKGTVADFQKGAVLDNYITVDFGGEYDLYNLVGQHIYIENDGVDNAVYAIKGAELMENGSVKLDLGTITLIRGMVDEYDLNAGYTYNIKEGQAFTIPISTVNDDSPVFDPIGNQIVTVGDTLKIPVSATTKSGAPVTYELAADLPNASVMDGYFYFTPTSTQRGSKHAAVKAVNGSLETAVHFTIEVVGTSGGTGGGGGGGGGGSEEEPEDVTYEDLGNNIFKDPNGNLIDAGLDGIPGTPDDKPYEEAVAPTETFVDLGNHAWAKDAIYRLVDAGVIKGVAEDKFAPGNQITRADFAILLVRAWNLTADDLGAFDDVAASDYFAKEVGIASALGIVNGVGDSKFAPKDPITREQMMVMLSRTLEAVKAEVKEAPDDILADFTDADLISDYAVESVKSMVAGGFIQGANGKINPQGNATRAEVAVLLDRILSK